MIFLLKIEVLESKQLILLKSMHRWKNRKFACFWIYFGQRFLASLRSHSDLYTVCIRSQRVSIKFWNFNLYSMGSSQIQDVNLFRMKGLMPKVYEEEKIMWDRFWKSVNQRVKDIHNNFMYDGLSLSLTLFSLSIPLFLLVLSGVVHKWRLGHKGKGVKDFMTAVVRPYL